MVKLECPLLTQSGHPSARHAKRIELPLVDAVQILPSPEINLIWRKVIGVRKCEK